MSMIRLKLDLSGPDEIFISKCYRYHSGLSTLALYRNHPDQLAGTDLLKTEIDLVQTEYEGGAHGDRIHIMKRRTARTAVTDMFKKIRNYLQSIATEEDIPDLVQAGFEVIQYGGGRKKGNRSQGHA